MPFFQNEIFSYVVFLSAIKKLCQIFYSLLEQKETITLSAVDSISLKYMKLKSQ